MTVRRLLGLCAVSVATLALGVSAAGAAEYPPSSASASASASTVSPGGTLTITGSGCLANSEVSMTLLSDPVSLGLVTANAGGAFSTAVTIPADTPAGAHTIVVACTGADGNAVTQNIAIAVAASASRSDTLPRTGSDSPPVILIGAGLLLVGGVLAVAARRRRTASITS